MPRFSRFYVLYKNRPEPGQTYRQIVARPSDDGTKFEVYIFGGDVVQTDPNFKVDSLDAEYYSHPTEDSAHIDADKEYAESIKSGWLPYKG
jgi:hypothetical protein